MDSALREEISQLIQAHPVVLYMKGTRDAPQCGFSAKVVEILDALLPEYVAVDVLADPAVREGIKEFSAWPTIPQLFVRGKFVGGADIVAALSESGELRDALADLVLKVEPRITLSDEAKRELVGALEGPDECVRLDVSPTFVHDLAVGIPDPRDVIVEANGVRVSMTAGVARRADGIHIGLVQTPDGPAFKIENPNEPPRVKALTAAELHGRLQRGDDLALVDARTSAEHALANITNGRLFDQNLREELGRGSRERAIVVYCHHGVRSQRLAESLISEGFRDVYNLTGGIDAWSRDVDPDVPRY